MRRADAETVADLITQLGYPSDRAAIEQRLAHLRAGRDEAVLVAVDQADRPIGWVHVGLLARLQVSEVAEVHGLVVDHGHRDLGIGADLLHAAEAWAKEHGAVEMIVRTRTTRMDAHRFYEREGYRLTKESRVYAKRVEQQRRG